MNTPTRKERIAQRQEELTNIQLEISQCNSNIAANRERRNELAKQYNNKLAFVGHLYLETDE